MRARGHTASRPGDPSRDLLDERDLEVPATVVCALCGDPDCAGCEEAAFRSGVVAIVAWERRALPLLLRLWTTARSTTRDAEAFFGTLPDGPVLPALRFAMVCELIAAAGVVAMFTPLALLLAPGWLSSLAADPTARSAALRMFALGAPAFAALLVGAHAAHGLTIHWGAARQGVPGARTRALRFGLYACGWDLVIGPVGAIVVLLTEGPARAFALLGDSARVPGRATRAYLAGAYRLDEPRTKRALAFSYVGTVVVCVAGAFLLFAALVALAVAT